MPLASLINIGHVASSKHPVSQCYFNYCSETIIFVQSTCEKADVDHMANNLWFDDPQHISISEVMAMRIHTQQAISEVMASWETHLAHEIRSHGNEGSTHNGRDQRLWQ